LLQYECITCNDVKAEGKVNNYTQIVIFDTWGNFDEDFISIHVELTDVYHFLSDPVY